MKFSIVIPAYNEQDWIPQTLLAVLAQTYQDYEVLVVDNNSSDNTVQTVKLFSDMNDKIRLVSCPTPGILYARNCGLKEATGDVIVQLDADNIPPPYWLERAAKHLSDKTVVGLGGFYDYYDAPFWFRYGGLFVQWLTLPFGNWYVQTRKDPHFIKGAFMIGGNAFIRKWVLDDMHGYDTSHTFCSEDLVTARAVAQRGWVRMCKDMTVRSSARRHKKLGYTKVQEQYNRGTSAVLQGSPIPKQPEETQHPR